MCRGAHSRFPGAVCRQRWTVRLGEVEPVFGQTGRVVLDITARTAHDGALKWTRAPSTPRAARSVFATFPSTCALPSGGRWSLRRVLQRPGRQRKRSSAKSSCGPSRTSSSAPSSPPVLQRAVRSAAVGDAASALVRHLPRRMRSDGLETVNVRTSRGTTVPVTTPYYREKHARRAKRRPGLYPIGANLFSQRGRRILACGCMTRRAGTVDEDWDVLLSFLPQDWRELAQDTGALKGLRKDKTVDNLLRTLLLHLGCGHSLRETVVRARQAHLADLSDVALLKRLKKSKGWLHALCVRLFEEQGLAVIPGGAFQVRAVDATTVKEPGPSGSLWRVHYKRGPAVAGVRLLQADGDRRAGHGRIVGAVPDPCRRPCAGRPRLFDRAGHSPRGGRGRAADCACQYGVAAAVYGGRAAVRPACRGVVGHAAGRRPLLGDHGRGARRRRRPGG